MINPQQFRLLLAGPRVSRLRPFVVARGYLCDAATDGQTALEYLRDTPRHVLLVELELGDMMIADLLATVNEENLAGAVILLEDPSRSGLIVSTLTRGVDGYVATPPDEGFLFRLIERQLLAQWAIAQSGALEVDTAEKARLEKQLNVERAKVTQLIKDLAGLREELAQAQVQATTAKAAVEAAKTATRPAVEKATRQDRPASAAAAGDGAYQTDQRTSPRGYQRGEIEALLDDDSAGHPTTQTTAPARPRAVNVVEIGFEEPSGTHVGVDLRSPDVAKPALEDKSESDLFLDLDAEADEPGEEPTTAGLPPTLPGGARAVAKTATKPLTDPFEDSLDE